MKIAKSAYTIPRKGEQQKPAARKSVILLVPEEEEEVSADRIVSYQLLTDPAQPESNKYKFPARILHGDEDVRTCVKWLLNLQKIWTGLGADTWATRKPITENLMAGMPVGQFQTRLGYLQQKRMERRIRAAGNQAARQVINQCWSQPRQQQGRWRHLACSSVGRDADHAYSCACTSQALYLTRLS